MSQDKDDLDALVDKLHVFQTKSYEAAMGYEQVVVGLGYAAFFALWDKMAGDLPRTTVLLSGGLIGVSLLVFIAWTISLMVWRMAAMRRFAKVFQSGKAPRDLLADHLSVETSNQKAAIWLMKVWPPVFVLSVATGISGAGLLVGSAFWHAVYSAPG